MTDRHSSELEHEVQRHGVMYLVSSAGITLLGFLATIFYAHWVGADVLGQYMVFVSCLSILSLFCDLGIGYATTYRICEGKDPDVYFSAGVILRLTLLAIVSVVLVFFGGLFIGDFRNNALFWVLIVVLIISTLTSAISTSLGASNRLGLAASVSLINNTMRILVQALAVFAGFQVYGLIGGMVAGLLVELAIDLRYLDYRIVRFDQEHAKKIFSFSSWAFLSTTCTVLFDNANLLIISYFMTVADAGIFGVCWTFSFFALFVSTALVNTLFVKVSRWKASGDWNAITVALSRAMSYALVLAIPMLIGGAILGKDLLYYLYGSSFVVGATALIIIIGARVVQSLFQIYSNFLMATDHVQHQFYGLVTGIVIGIALAFILVPLIGLPGAAVASLVNVIISTLICRHYLKGVVPIRIERDIVRDIFLASGVMTIVLLVARFLPLGPGVLTTGAMVVLGTVVYLAVLFTLNARIRDDIFKIVRIRWIS